VLKTTTDESGNPDSLITRVPNLFSHPSDEINTEKSLGRTRTISSCIEIPDKELTSHYDKTLDMIQGFVVYCGLLAAIGTKHEVARSPANGPKIWFQN